MILKGKINLGCLKGEEDITVIPSKEKQTITAKNQNNLIRTVFVEPVSANIDENINEENIKEGITILGVEGKLTEKKIEENKTVKSTNEQQIITPTEGYDGIGQITVKPMMLEMRSVRPSAKMNLIEVPTAGHDGFEQFMVEKVEADIDENITEENIREGVSILGVTGKLHESIMEDVKEVKSTEEEQTIAPSEGYDGIKSIKVQPIVLEGRSQRASKDEDITVTPSEGYDAIGEVIIPKIRLKSKTATPSTTEQTIKLNVLEAMSNDALSEVVIAPVDSSIDESIIPENIKEGITVLGVEGTHKGGGEDTLTALFNDTLTSYNVPYGTEKIKDNFFNGNTNLVEITLPDTISSYGKNAFEKSGITSLFIPKNKDNKKITFDSYTFGNMQQLKDATLEEGLLINSSSYMFYQSQIETAVVPYAESGMFMYCRNLKNITFNDPENTNKKTAIATQAFRDCELLEAIDIPDFITSIGSYSFSGCKSLTSFEIKAINCSMNNNSFTGCTGITDFRVANGHKQALYLSGMTALTHDSLVALINNLGTVSNLALNIGSTNKAKLSEEEIAVATNKGWVVS